MEHYREAGGGVTPQKKLIGWGRSALRCELSSQCLPTLPPTVLTWRSPMALWTQQARRTRWYICQSGCRIEWRGQLAGVTGVQAGHVSYCSAVWPAQTAIHWLSSQCPLTSHVEPTLAPPSAVRSIPGNHFFAVNALTLLKGRRPVKLCCIPPKGDWVGVGHSPYTLPPDISTARQFPLWTFPRTFWQPSTFPPRFQSVDVFGMNVCNSLNPRFITVCILHYVKKSKSDYYY